MSRLGKYTKTILCMTLCAAMTFMDMPLTVSAAETVTESEVMAESAVMTESEVMTESAVETDSTEKAKAEEIMTENAGQAQDDSSVGESLAGEEETEYPASQTTEESAAAESEAGKEETETAEETVEEAAPDSESTEETAPTETTETTESAEPTETTAAETEELLTQETALETETQGLPTETAEEETEAEESTQELLFADTDIAHGEYKENGSNLTWVIDADGKLTVEGTGDCYDVNTSSTPRMPWDAHKEKILSAEVKMSGMTSTALMFSQCTNLKEIKFSGFDTGSVTTMWAMFSMCYSLESIDVSSFDTGSVTNMHSMFEACYSLESIDLSSLDTSSVTNMGSMFSCCWNLKNINLSGLDTSSVIYMGYMFDHCDSLESIDLSGLDTDSVTNMQQMFFGCISLKSINLSGLDTSNVTNMGGMFAGCNSLESIDEIISSLDTGSVTDMGSMFSACISLKSINLSGLDTSSVTHMQRMFSQCDSLENIDVSSLDTSSVTNMSAMFSQCDSLESIDVSSLDTGSVTDMSYMFSACISLKSINLSGLDTSSVTNMVDMFAGCSSLESIDEIISSLDTSSVTGIGGMFRDCSSLESIDVSSLDTSGVTHMNDMFRGCSSLKSINLSGLDTSSVKQMGGMFRGCSSLESIDVSSFNTGSVTYVSGMFEGCSSLKRLDLSMFDLSGIPENAQMEEAVFGGDTSLISIYAPRNLKNGSVPLPDKDASGNTRIWKDMEGNDYSALPQNRAETVLLIRDDYDALPGAKITAYKSKTSYHCGDTIDTGDITVMYYGADGTIKEASGFTTDAASVDMSTPGSKTLTISYTHETNTFTTSIDLTVTYDMEKNLTITLPEEEYVYSGRPYKPVPAVSRMVDGESRQLVKGTDYTVSYKNNINACEDGGQEEAPSVIIKGCGLYSGTAIKNFIIKKADAPTPEEQTIELTDYNGLRRGRTYSLSGSFAKYGTKTGYAVGTPAEDDTISGSVLADMPTVSGYGMLTYSTNAGSGGDFVTVPVTVSFVNYKDSTVNVKIVLVKGAVTEKKKVTISGIEIKDSVYNKQPASYTGTAKVTAEDGTDLTNSVKLTYTYSGTQADGSVYAATSNAPVNAGNYRLTVAVAQDNETYTGSAEISFKIAKAPLTITARDMGVKIGAPLPQAEEYLYDMTGLLEGDKLDMAPVLACNITDTTAAGTYDIIPSGADAGMNYEITYKNGMLTVSETGESAAYYTVIFNMFGKGSDITNTGVKEGSTLEQPQTPTADGYTFTGWYKDKDCTVLWDFAKDTVQADTTLYAGWKANGASGGDDDDSEDAFPVEWEYPKTLQVASTELKEDNIEVKAKKRIYDGTPYTPDVKVTIKDAKGKKTVLTEGADYSVKYSNNVNAGEKGTVKVRGNGAYTGIVTKTFTISPKPVKKLKTITGGMIANADTNLESPEFLASLPVYVYDGTKKLTYNEDYTLTIIKGDVAKKGKLQVAVSAKDGSNYTGTGKDAAKATITVYETTGKNFKGIINSDDVVFEKESDKSQTYTGKALKPAFKVTVNGTVLGKKDFSVKYTNNKEAGTAYATITGKGGYVGSVVRTFSIEPVAESGGFALKKAIKAPTYNGKVQKPKVTITSGGKTLKAGKDYRISYSNNLHATPENAADQDKAKITVTGIGNYKGMKGTFYFSINRLAIKKASVKGTQNNLVITYAKHNLVEGYDYEKPVYEPAGKKVNVTLTGQGDFTGTVTKKVKAQ